MNNIIKINKNITAIRGEDSTMRKFIVCIIVNVIKSRRLRWAGHATTMEKVGVLSKFNR